MRPHFWEKYGKKWVCRRCGASLTSDRPPFQVVGLKGLMIMRNQSLRRAKVTHDCDQVLVEYVMES